MSIASIRRLGTPAPISRIAAEWVLREEAGGLSERDAERFAVWLAEHPAHVEAYEDAIWALEAAARHAGDSRIREMRETALAARGERSMRPRLRSIGGGALAASVAAFLIFFAPPASIPSPSVETAAPPPRADPRRAVHETAVGERLVVTLPDGSVATLDTNSQLRVVYSATERGLHLLRGQAMFDVAHGRTTPFRVHAAGQRIVAIGTSFNVRLRNEHVEVALVEGTVKVMPASPSRGAAVREVTMRAGERLEAGPGGLVSVRAANVSQVAAWQNGELVFNDTRLADAVAEINRYTNRPIQLADATIGEYRISGVFRASDPERFSRAMSEVLPVEATLRRDEGPSLRARRP